MDMDNTYSYLRVALARALAEAGASLESIADTITAIEFVAREHEILKRGPVFAGTLGDPSCTPRCAPVPMSFSSSDIEPDTPEAAEILEK